LKLGELSAPIRQTALRGGGFGSEVEVALIALADGFAANPDATLETVLNALKPKKPKAAPKPKVFEEPPTSPIVIEALRQLQEISGHERGKALVEEIRRFKKPYTAPLTKEIAGRFAGARLAFASRDAALDYLKDMLGRREWERGGVEIVERQTSGFATK